jgi:Fur family transcriptional regulator, peroxide stress response regulator
MAHSNDEIRKCLEIHTIRPSYHRIKVLEYLLSKENHPTVDEIYSALAIELPTLSKTTVYNTLTLFIKAGLVRLVTTEGNETRYDANVADHGHFRCEQCGKIYDFLINLDLVKTPGLEQFKVREKSVYYKGICPKCPEK